MTKFFLNISMTTMLEEALSKEILRTLSTIPNSLNTSMIFKKSQHYEDTQANEK